jgi:signal peptidase II
VDRVGRHGAAILFGTAAAVYVVDRLSKVWAERTLQDHPIDLIRGVLTLRFTTNSGGAFSLGQSAPWLFATFTIGVSLLIVITAFRRRGALTSVALGLILGGALGNLTDRAVRAPGLKGRVVDFIDFHVWPIFNVADAAIVVGAILLAWSSFRTERGRDRLPAEEASRGA